MVYREKIEKYIRAANYLSAAQIYLQNNFLLEEPLKKDDIKERLLGHWGTCPGINFTYAHLNRVIIEHNLNMAFVLGPGHGFPAIQANLFLEGTFSKYYKEVPRNAEGIGYMSKYFSWPYGFPSHSNPTAPGVILEGGELGYSLSTAFGAILDNPKLIVACLIGDGEAETGPTATAWHLNKLIDPVHNGAVLPILHVNGYKISGPTFFGRMSDIELTNLFRGYGYEPHIVDAYAEGDVHERMITVLNNSVEAIQFTKHCAEQGSLHEPPRWPMIILKTPKGWNSIAELRGKKIEDNHYSHQVIAGEARTNDQDFEALEGWLRSYKFEELFDGEKFHDDIESLIPVATTPMGDCPHTMGGEPNYKPLKLPELEAYSPPAGKICNNEHSSMEIMGTYLRDVMKLNEAERNIRLMSPDETYSNKLDRVFDVTKRAFVWPHKSWDKDIAWDGRVLEMLSEHSLQGLMQGYVVTGRHAVFASYEAFLQIVSSMVDQYAKFLRVSRGVKWRGDVPSLNYILTSSGWRQEHNGFSHQNPGFIDDLLQRQGDFINVYFPADANTAIAVQKKTLSSKNEINATVVGKRPMPSWRTLEEAKKDVEDGISIWDFVSEDDPHIVYSAVGDYLTNETLAAMYLVKKEVPKLRMRYVNITTLSSLGIGGTDNRLLSNDIDYFYTPDKTAIINFHGYPQTIKQLFFDYGLSSKRFKVHGYEEQGSTTTPFDMHVRNHTDRYNLVMDAFNVAEKEGVITLKDRNRLIAKYEKKLSSHKKYIKEHGADPAELDEWKWTCDW